MSKYYTYVGAQSGKLFHRYVENGERHIEVVSMYQYELFTKCPYGQYVGLDGAKLDRITFDSIHAMSDFLKTANTTQIYGNTSPVQQFIVKEYPDEIKVLSPMHCTLNFDIEVEHDNGFPKPEHANDEIMSISYEKIIGNEKVVNYTLGLRDYKGVQSDTEIYIKCIDEKDLLRKFIAAWREINPDFISGWAVATFDIPYFVNRCNKILGVAETNKLSPFSAYVKEPVRKNNRAPQLEYEILGVTTLDYLELYKKYAPKKLESYKLDFVSEYELGDKKVRFDEYGNNLMRLYRGQYDIVKDVDVTKLSEKDRWCRLRTMLNEQGVDRI